MESAQPPALSKTVIETVEFPEEDESSGEIIVALFGPSYTESVAIAAVTVLLTYLAGSAVSVLQNVMVEKEELAGSIAYWLDTRPNTVIWFGPTGVATEKLEFVENRLFELLKDVASKPLDMRYLRDCLNRERRQIKFQAESSGSFYASAVITDFLFGKRDGSTLKEDLGTLAEYDALENWTEAQWTELLKKWISDAPHISVLGKPSKELAAKFKSEEERRIAARKEKLGPEGLEKLGEKLKKAIAENDAPVSQHLELATCHSGPNSRCRNSLLIDSRPCNDC